MTWNIKLQTWKSAWNVEYVTWNTVQEMWSLNGERIIQNWKCVTGKEICDTDKIDILFFMRAAGPQIGGGMLSSIRLQDVAKVVVNHESCNCE